jgi:hypothetical protein
LAELEQHGQVITFQAVARRAGVSRQWLYEQPDLRTEIQRLRALNQKQPSESRTTEASLRQRNQTLLEENRRLRHEITDLKTELALAYGYQRANAVGR